MDKNEIKILEHDKHFNIQFFLGLVKNLAIYGHQTDVNNM